MSAPKPVFPTIRDLPLSPLRACADALANLLFPEDCLVCGAPVSRLQDRGVCGRCWDRVLQLQCAPPWCPSCGLPYTGLGDGTDHICARCILNPPPYSGARSWGYYRSELRTIIHSLKFRGSQKLTDLLAPLLASSFIGAWSCGQQDCIVPVPLHPLRERRRGFNQAALLARDLSRLVSVPFREKALFRVRNTPPQVGLSNRERARNMKDAFRCNKQSSIEGARVVLVDDVMTTGETVAGAAAELLEGGALRVSVLTVARAVAGSDY